MDIESFRTMEKVSLKLIENENQIIIKSRFKLFNKANFGMVLISLLSFSCLVICYLFGTDWVLFLFGILSAVIFLISVLSVFKQSSDYLKITKSEIQSNNSFQKKSFPLNSGIFAKMKQETVFTKLAAQSGSGSYWRVVEIFLEKEKTDFRLLDFQIEHEHFLEADQLGSAIVELINQKIKAAEN